MCRQIPLDEERRAMIDAINQFGDGSHPEATPQNLNTFSDDYVLRCLTRAYEATTLPGRPR